MTSRDESGDQSRGTEIDSGTRGRESAGDGGVREGLWGVSDGGSMKKVPGGADTSPASLFLTRQPVLATFSRSVASASCQRKQRARFVKPKVKLRSNEGTILLGGTSGIILPQLPAARMRRGPNAKAPLAEARQRRRVQCGDGSSPILSSRPPRGSVVTKTFFGHTSDKKHHDSDVEIRLDHLI